MEELLLLASEATTQPVGFDMDLATSMLAEIQAVENPIVGGQGFYMVDIENPIVGGRGFDMAEAEALLDEIGIWIFSSKSL